MQLAEFDSIIRDACPKTANAVFAVVLAGYPPNLSIRFCGSTGGGILEKYLKSVRNLDLRQATNAPQNFLEAKVLFVFVSFIRAGSISEFRRTWYREIDNRASRAFGRNYSPKELLSLLENSELQFQASIGLDEKTVNEVKLSKRLEARVHSPKSLQLAMQLASKQNSIGWAQGW